MKLVEHAWTREEEEAIRDESTSRHNLISVCQHIQLRAVTKRCELEGMATARFKPYYIGMGAWAGKWLKDHNNKF